MHSVISSGIEMASHVRHCLINLVSGKLNCIQSMWGAGQKIICSWLNIFTPLIMRGYKKQKIKQRIIYLTCSLSMIITLCYFSLQMVMEDWVILHWLHMMLFMLEQLLRKYHKLWVHCIFDSCFLNDHYNTSVLTINGLVH